MPDELDNRVKQLEDALREALDLMEGLLVGDAILRGNWLQFECSDSPVTRLRAVLRKTK